jgi:muconolactone delta-isomerase
MPPPPARQIARGSWLGRDICGGSGHCRALGLGQAHDTGRMQPILASLPLDAWMSAQTTPLTPHPSDPALTSS